MYSATLLHLHGILAVDPNWSIIPHIATGRCHDELVAQHTYTALRPINWYGMEPSREGLMQCCFSILELKLNIIFVQTIGQH